MAFDRNNVVSNHATRCFEAGVPYRLVRQHQCKVQAEIVDKKGRGGMKDKTKEHTLTVAHNPSPDGPQEWMPVCFLKKQE